MGISGAIYDLQRSLFFKRVTGTGMIDVLVPDSLVPKDLSLDDLNALYDFSGLSKRVVKLFPNACWRLPVYVQENENVEETQFETAYRELSDDMNFPYFFRKLDIVSGIGQYGCMMLGFDDGRSTDKPVGKATKLTFIRCARQKNIAIDSWDQNVNSPRFGQPEMYSIKWVDPINQALQDQKVHWTRIIHVAETEDESEIYGVPRIQPVQYPIIYVERALGAASGGFFRHGMPSTVFTTDPESEVSDEDITSMKEQLSDYAEGLNKYLFSRGITAQVNQGQLASPDAFIMPNLQYIACTMGIPLRMLLGSESGQYASTQDRNSFQDVITTRQNNFCKPRIVEAFVDALLRAGVLPKPSSGSYNVMFEQEQLASMLEKSQSVKSKSECIKDYSVGGVSQVISFEAFLRHIMDLDDAEVMALVHDHETFTPEEYVTDPKNQPRPDPAPNGEQKAPADDAQNYV